MHYWIELTSNRVKEFRSFFMRISLTLMFIFFFVSCASKKNDENSSNIKKAEIYYNHGTQSLLTKNYTKALKNLSQAHLLNPNDSKIHNNLGMAFYFKNRPARGIKHLKQALKLDPKNTEARLNLATVYMNTKKYNDAKMQFDMVLNDLTFGGQFRTYFNLGLLSLKQNNQQQAINYFKQSLDESNNYCPSHFQLGNIYFNQGDYSKALNSYKSAAQGACYDSPGPHFKQGLSYMKLKEYDIAQDKFNEVIERFSDQSNYQSMANKKLKELRKLKTLENSYDFDPSSSARNILTPDF